MTVAATDRVSWRGVTLDRRTKRALEWAEHRSGVTISPSQGSWSTSVGASGSTHAGSSAVDIRVSQLTDRDRKRLVHALKDAGFAAWYRRPSTAWGPHVHAVLVGNAVHGASASARWQMFEFDARRSGLTSQGADRTYRPSPPVRFNFAKRKPVPR